MAVSGNTHSAAGLLGAQVRAARVRRNVSGRELARALEVSPATISQIENGRTGLSAARLSRIAEVLGTTVSEILDIAAHTYELGQSGKPPLTETHRPAEIARTSEPVSLDPQISDWRVYGPVDFDPVLRAALDEIVDIGYHGATVRSIAARCGFSVSGIYHYYTSKQQMLVSILEWTMTELLARARAARAEGRTAVDRFRNLIEHLALYHTYRRELSFVGVSEMRSLDEPSRRHVAEMRTVQQRMVDEEVEAAVRLEHFRKDHPHEAARAAVTMCTALANWWRPGGRFSPEETAEQYVEFALAMMRENGTLPLPGS